MIVDNHHGPGRTRQPDRLAPAPWPGAGRERAPGVPGALRLAWRSRGNYHFTVVPNTKPDTVSPAAKTSVGEPKPL